MKRVEACFELYHQENEKASCNANSQSEDIDECISLISPEIPDCCLEIILKHGLYLLVPDDWIQDAGCRKLDIECRWLLAIGYWRQWLKANSQWPSLFCSQALHRVCH